MITTLRILKHSSPVGWDHSMPNRNEEEHYKKENVQMKGES